jgi:EAL domain-containing protein (putative c-di-GMP-specific phosphodiesterase class I)
VLTSACAAFTSLGVAPGVRLSVNLSVGQLADPGLCDRVVGILQRHHLTPHDLTVELTESATLPGWTVGGFAAPESSLMALRALGATLALDDFGTGYSSLAYIRRFPISTLKIDRSFVEGILECHEDRSVVAAVVGLANNLGLTVVAEGVESPAQLDALRSLGCTAVQGYLIGAAMSTEELSVWFSRSSTAP